MNHRQTGPPCRARPAQHPTALAGALATRCRRGFARCRFNVRQVTVSMVLRARGRRGDRGSRRALRRQHSGVRGVEPVQTPSASGWRTHPDSIPATNLVRRPRAAVVNAPRRTGNISARSRALLTDNPEGGQSVDRPVVFFVDPKDRPDTSTSTNHFELTFTRWNWRCARAAPDKKARADGRDKNQTIYRRTDPGRCRRHRRLRLFGGAVMWMHDNP